MGNHTLVRTDHLDQSMATQIEGNINAVSTTQLQKLAPTGRSLSSIRNELERGESTLISESPHTSLFVETEDGLELNTDHAITLAHEAVQTLVSRLIPAPVANWFSQTFSEETTDSLPPAVEPDMLPPENTPHAPAPQSAYRYNLEVACPPDMHQKYLPGIVSLAKISGKEDAVTLARNTEQLEHYWLKAMTITNDSRKLYYKPQGSTCSNLFSFEVSLVDANTEKASEALIPVTPTVQIGKRLGLPTKGYFYHFHNKKLIQEFQIQKGSSCFLVTRSYENTLTDEIKIHKLQNHILLYWRLHDEVINNQHLLYREEKLTQEELGKAGKGNWLDENAVKFNPNQAISKLKEPIISGPTTHTVESGDYLSKIAKKAGTTVEALQKINPEIKDPSRISIGQIIKVPATSSDISKPSSDLPAEAPSVIHRQKDIYYNYPFPNVGPHHLAIKKSLTDPNIIAVNLLDTTKTRSLSKKGRDLLKSIEELRTKPYDDKHPKKKLTKYITGRTTIGYGYLIPKNEWDLYKDGITKEKASTLFDEKIKPYEEAVDATLLYHVSQQQFDAAVIFTYNIGENAFKDSSAAKLMNNPSAKTNYKTLKEAWQAYAKTTKRDKDGNPIRDSKTNEKIKIILPGLLNRRNCELKIYHHGVYEKW